jgi:hypothetical protein
MQQEHEPDHPTSSPSDDYSYDLAHEVGGSETPPSVAEVEHRQTVHVATESADLDQDYSYDLAHDIPRLPDE